MTDDNAAVVLGSQGAITLAGNVSNKVLALLFVILATRVVSATTFGVFTLAISIISVAQMVSSLNLNRSIDYFVPRALARGDREAAGGLLVQIVTAEILLSGGLAALLFVGRNHIAVAFGMPQLRPALAILAWVLPFVILRQALVRWFASIKRLEYRIYVRDVAQPLLKLVVLLVAAIIGFKLTALASAYLIGAVAACVLGGYILYTRTNWTFRHSDGFFPPRTVVEYALPLLFAGFIYTLIAQIDFFIIGLFDSSSAVGEYKVAFLLASNILIVLRSLTPIFKPLIAEVQKPTDPQVLTTRYQTAARWSVMFTIPPAITLISDPNAFLNVLFTASYGGAAAALSVLTIGYMLNAAFGPDGMMLEGLGKTRLTLLNSLIFLGLNTTLDIILVPRIGILGAAIGTTVAMTATGMLTVFEVFIVSGAYPFSKPFGRTVLALPPALLLTKATAWVVGGDMAAVVILPVVALLSYGILHHFLAGYTKQDEEMAKQLDSLLGRQVFQRVLHL